MSESAADGLYWSCRLLGFNLSYDLPCRPCPWTLFVTFPNTLFGPFCYFLPLCHTWRVPGISFPASFLPLFRTRALTHFCHFSEHVLWPIFATFPNTWFDPFLPLFRTRALTQFATFHLVQFCHVVQPHVTRAPDISVPEPFCHIFTRFESIQVFRLKIDWNCNFVGLLIHHPFWF